MELKIGNNKNRDYKIEEICNIAFYVKELKLGHLLKLCYLIL